MAEDTVDRVTRYSGAQFVPIVGRNEYSTGMPQQIDIEIDDPNVPVVLGPPDLHIRQIEFIPYSENGGDVFIQIRDKTSGGIWVDAAGGVISPSSAGIEWDAPVGSHFSAQDFRLRGLNSGDGVNVIIS